jgi:hypothetical protein
MVYTRKSFQWDKLEVSTYIASYDYEHFAGDLDTVIGQLQRLKENYAGVYHRIHFEVNYDYENTNITVYGYAWETDEVFAQRIQNQEELIKDSKYIEKKRIEVKRQKDYETYLELKKKFEKE